MMHKILNWKLKKVLFIFIGVCILYILIRANKYQHDTKIFIPKTQPNTVWEFVADFSNMKFLNPSLENFNIIKEDGNYEHWVYSVEYFERLSHWPYTPHVSVAHFSIKASPKKDVYYINSVHRTCFWIGFYCVETTSTFKFTHNNASNGTICEENLIYQCPVILSRFCKREVIAQRKAIMNNLFKHFTKK